MPDNFCRNTDYFNPRSYKRSDSGTVYCITCFCRFQSTLLQEERPAPRLPSRRTPHISIHAPTRGATGAEHLRITEHHISIHAPTRGATITCEICRWILLFQSTLLQEERQQKCTIFLMHLCNNYCIVSI